MPQKIIEKWLNIRWTLRILSLLMLVILTVYGQSAHASEAFERIRAAINSGDLDTSFGVDGFVLSDISALESDSDPKIAIQDDGKIVLAAQCEDDEVFCVIRYTVDGKLDTTFGASNGYVKTDISGDDDSIRDIALQSDGKIVVAGDCDDPQEICIARYNTDGSLDTANFGSPNGYIQFDYVLQDEAESIALQSDGKILVAGECNFNNFICLGRVKSDGSGLDTANFNSPNGFIAINITSDYDEDPEIALFQDGSIVIAATCNDYEVFCLAKYNSDGSLDTSFGSPNGFITHDITDGEDYVVDIAPLAGGKILVAGTCNNGNYICIARFNKNGSLDTSFASPRGYVLTQLLDDYTAARGMAVQDNGRIVVAGECRNPTQHFCLVRYTIDGKLDTSFSDDGYIIEDLGPGEDEGEDVALQGDMIIVAGECNGNDEICMARYYGSGREPVVWHKTGVSGGLYKQFGIWVNIPAGAIPSNSQSELDQCRLVLEEAGSAEDYGIQLRSYVYEIRIKCNNQLISELLLPIEICIPPKHADESEFGQLFHLHDGDSIFRSVLLTTTREGYVCGETNRLSLFLIGGATLPNTGFAPGRETQLASASSAIQNLADSAIRLEIPNLSINAEILGVGRSVLGWDVDWLGNNIGHLEGSAFPGTSGNSVLTGHVWGADGSPGPFNNLRQLFFGEQIMVHAFGQTFIYEVRSSNQIVPDENKVFGQSSLPYITLITCETFDPTTEEYVHRRIVRAYLVEVR